MPVTMSYFVANFKKRVRNLLVYYVLGDTKGQTQWQNQETDQKTETRGETSTTSLLGTACAFLTRTPRTMIVSYSLAAYTFQRTPQSKKQQNPAK